MHENDSRTPWNELLSSSLSTRDKLASAAGLRRYVIAALSEETECDECGYPLYVGDDAYVMKEDDGRTFCTRSCAREHGAIK